MEIKDRKIISGNTLMQDLEKKGYLPENCYEVTITANVNQVAEITYSCYVDDKISVLLNLEGEDDVPTS